MSKRTKKVGNTGWMGPRYGIRIRRRVLEIDRARSLAASCPRCSTVTVQRIASGVYACRRCGTQFASGAYTFSPPPPITRSQRTETEAPARA
ncbi:MAG TPA: 50S ribosomal protein L37ae [Thermoplasmata archaeon]|nr:50S ribosomal protein L37ae [Thermoplasmata archaeon]HUJ78050.1 50S ribosomal protein L37ae [Thermoplasmata archaeon]